MFDHLTARLSRTIENLRGRGRITDENVAETLREARVALLEADVALPVVKSFIESVRAKALGAEVLASLTPDRRSSVFCTPSWCSSWADRARPGSCARNLRWCCCWRACRAPARPPPRRSSRAG